MYSKAIRTNLQCVYSQVKYAITGLARFQFPHEATKPAIKAKHHSAHLKALEQTGATYNFDGSQTVSYCRD